MSKPLANRSVSYLVQFQKEWQELRRIFIAAVLRKKGWQVIDCNHIQDFGWRPATQTSSVCGWEIGSSVFANKPASRNWQLSGRTPEPHEYTVSRSPTRRPGSKVGCGRWLQWAARSPFPWRDWSEQHEQSREEWVEERKTEGLTFSPPQSTRGLYSWRSQKGKESSLVVHPRSRVEPPSLPHPVRATVALSRLSLRSYPKFRRCVGLAKVVMSS